MWVLLQVQFLYLEANQLVGNVPDPWDNLISVSCCGLPLAA